MADAKPEVETMTRAERLRQAGLFVLFSAVLLIPKALGLRRRRKLWSSLRILAALAGGLLVAGGLAGGPRATDMLLGSVLILLALLIPPLKKSGSADAEGCKLGALVALNGGLYRSAKGNHVRVRLYVAPERLHVLDERERPVLEIPVSEIATVRVAGEEERNERTLVIEWRGGKAEFRYGGFFADHLAEVARRTVDTRLRSKLRVLH